MDFGRYKVNIRTTVRIFTAWISKAHR